MKSDWEELVDLIQQIHRDHGVTETDVDRAIREVKNMSKEELKEQLQEYSLNGLIKQ